MKDKFDIHRDSELWEYVHKVEVTQELVDFFEEERKKSEREAKSDKRHIAFEEIDDDTLYNYIFFKQLTLEEQADISIEMKKLKQFLNTLTKKQRDRYCLHKIYELSLSEIATIENTNKRSVWDSIQQVEEKLKKIKK